MPKHPHTGRESFALDTGSIVRVTANRPQESAQGPRAVVVVF